MLSDVKLSKVPFVALKPKMALTTQYSILTFILIERSDVFMDEEVLK